MEEIERQLSDYQFGPAQERFDEVKASVQRSKLEQEARQLLEHPDVELDRRLRETLEAEKVDSALQALRAKIAGELPAGAPQDPIAGARAALGQAPEGLLPGPEEDGPDSQEGGVESQDSEGE
jgi:hypothetical protein